MNFKWNPENLFLRLIILLLAIGTVVMYSASSFEGAMKHDDYMYYLLKHIVWLIVGCSAYFAASRLKYKRLKYVIPYLVGITWILIILAFIINPTDKPSRWLILFGRSWMTTSDIARIMLIIYTAYFLDIHQKGLSDWKYMLKNFSFVPGLTLIMILFQPDLGSTLMISLIIFSMLYIGEVSYRYILIIIASGLICVTIKVSTTSYMMARLFNWSPTTEISNDNQQLKSLWALGKGGWFGNGPGSSRMKDGHLPAAHTDFILPIIGEEYGFMGISALFILFIAMFHFGIQILKAASDRFGMFIVIGILLNIIFYFLINTSYAIGILPNTGLAMPFISYGGSNTIFTLLSIGLLMSIAREASLRSESYYRGVSNGS